MRPRQLFLVFPFGSPLAVWHPERKEVCDQCRSSLWEGAETEVSFVGNRNIPRTSTSNTVLS